MVGRKITALLRQALQDPASHQSEALASAAGAGWPVLALSIAFCVLSLSLITRNLLFPHPFVLGDEYYYSILSRYFGHNTELFAHDPYLPHYPDELYLRLFSIVHLWGDEFYAAVKVFNSVLLAAALVPIYATARFFLERKTALFLSIVSVFAPINSLTAYFMPESCYFLMFWLFAFFFLCNLPRHTMKAGAYGGALLALLVLIKPQAVAILAAAELTIAAMMLLHQKFEISRRDGLLSLISLNAGFIITLLIVHVGLFGHRDLNIFGFYTQFAGRMEKPLSFLSKALMVLIAHVVYTNIIFGLPLVVTLLGSLGLFSSDRPECRARLRVLCVFAILALIFLLAMTAKATVNFATGLGPSELRRLHGRYYDFILPMFLIAFFALGDPALARGGRRMLRLTLFVCLASVILGFVFISPRALVYSADYPEVAWLSNPFPGVGHIFWILAALVLVYYLIIGPQQKAAYSKYLVLSLLTGSVLVSLSLYRSAGTIPADRAGAMVQSLFKGGERDTGIVAGSNLGMIFRCLFQIDGNPFVLLLPRGTPIGRTQVGTGRRWLLSLDQYRIRVPSTTIVSGADFKILQMDRAGDLEFGKGKGGDGYLEGFYESESWGARSRESTARIDLDRPIHGDLILHLRGIAYGPNVGRLLNLEVGKIRTTLRYARDPTTVDVPLHLAEPADRLVISGLQPTSPASLGESSDERHLGVGLIALTIVDSTRQ